MSTKQGLKSPARRKFIRKAGVGMGAAGALALGLPDEPAKAAEASKRDPAAGGYRETEHVRKAYGLARF
jgi:hypothetical protein